MGAIKTSNLLTKTNPLSKTWHCIRFLAVGSASDTIADKVRYLPCTSQESTTLNGHVHAEVFIRGSRRYTSAPNQRTTEMPSNN